MKQIATIKSTGIGLSYQDLGRHGYTQYGIAPAGAMDPIAHQLANKLLDNYPNHTTIEITLGGAEIIFQQSTWIALTGPATSNLLEPNSAALIPAGKILRIHPAPHGIWSYLAIPGGFICEKSFGSHSRHERSDLGTNINTGTNLTANPSPNLYPQIATRTIHPDDIPNYNTHPIIEVHPTPHDIPTETLEKFYNTPWTISQQIDRTGYRLTGTPLPPPRPIPSLPTIPGCIQLPPNGQPIITLNDGPTTGGYPLLGIIDPIHLPIITQLQPGTKLAFTPINQQ